MRRLQWWEQDYTLPRAPLVTVAVTEGAANDVGSDGDDAVSGGGSRGEGDSAAADRATRSDDSGAKGVRGSARASVVRVGGIESPTAKLPAWSAWNRARPVRP